ncbi:MAG TPA: L-ribulose-5-phosphate 4-epimerase AraD [Chthoniobacterales bacterium]|jgi:L-ribulose-5-phosphate 4-epimerase|nr:L-ribulose-5-phosphate 4-epimerase AraD [Chthoniobacterales bacterium]
MLDELKREAWEANMALPGMGLVQLTFGNASAIDRTRGIFAIKPSGVSYSELRPEQMVLVDLNGDLVESDALRPSSDVATHRCLLAEFPSLGGIVHTHSACATAFAQAGREIPNFGTTHSDYFAGNIPVTRKMTDAEIHGGAYEWETGRVIVEHFLQNHLAVADYPAALVNRHAPFTWGETAAKAVEIAVAVEYIARMAIFSLQLEPGLSNIEPGLLRKHFQRKHGPQSYYGQGR